MIGTQQYTYTFKQDGANLTGKASADTAGEKREADVKEGKVEGDTVSFVEMLITMVNPTVPTFNVPDQDPLILASNSWFCE